MPVLANARQEQFAQKVASGLNLVEAYTSAGYSKAGARQSASRLLTNANISSRIAELQAVSENATSKAVAFDKARVLRRLDELSTKAEEDGNWAAAIRAEELIGRHRGMFIDRSDTTFRWSGRLEDLTDMQLELYEKSVAARYGLSEADGEAPVLQLNEKAS